MKNLSNEKVKVAIGPVQLYTLMCVDTGFFVCIYPSGRDTKHEDVEVALIVRPGQFDDLLS